MYKVLLLAISLCLMTACGEKKEVSVSGKDGTNGIDGANGTNGVNGNDGTGGAAGSNGATGLMGPTGQTGATGAIGPAGPAGRNGTNGTNGVNGTNGTDGKTSLIKLVRISAGNPCQYGGTAIYAGLDLNRDNQLTNDEVTSTSYVCDGAPTTTTTPSDHCNDGHGNDANNSGCN